jgi:hypothetical protein
MTVMKCIGFYLMGLVIFTSCTEDYIPKPMINKMFIDQNGGVVQNENIKLIFPKGAVDKKTQISFQNILSNELFYYSKTLSFFCSPIEILPGNLGFNVPVNILIAYDRYWFKTFDNQKREIHFDPNDLGLYRLNKYTDVFNEVAVQAELIDRVTITYTNDSIIISAELDSTGYYGVGISNENLQNDIGDFQSEIFFSDPAIKSWKINGKGTERQYTFCIVSNIAFSNLRSTNIQIIEWINFELRNAYIMSFSTTAPPILGKHTIFWNDTTLNNCEIYDNLSNILIRAKNSTEATIIYDTFDEDRRVVRGTIDFKGIATFYHDIAYTIVGDSNMYHIDKGYYDVNVVLQININSQ